jgi:SAM-dependent methyltransferase
MTGDYQTDHRMGLKLAAIPFPSFAGKTVLDVGTDHAYFAFMAAERGAIDVLGLDRNRAVRGAYTNLIELNSKRAAHEGRRCRFRHIDIGKQWKEFGRFDIVLVMSVFHHLFENCGDLSAVWFWLSRHVKADGLLIWEGPVDDADPVVQANVSISNRRGYVRSAITAAAREYFDVKFVGPALHEPTREVWTLKPHAVDREIISGSMVVGAGGATAAFEYADDRRIGEIESAIGLRPYPGSLNVRLDEAFDWETGYYRAQVLDVVDRSSGPRSDWAPRWARFYPVMIDGIDAHAFRFEGEHYDESFVELVAPARLRDSITGPRVTLCR